MIVDSGRESFLPRNVRCLWAKSKPRHPLWKHLLDASAVSRALPSPLLVFGWNSQETALLVGLHDIGKADAPFQHQIPEFSAELESVGLHATGDAKVRHEQLSSVFIKKKLDHLNPFLADSISRAVLAHHGYFDETPRPVSRVYADAQDRLYRMLRETLEVGTFPKASPANLSSFGIRLAGHIVLCDWIASNEESSTDSRLLGIDTLMLRRTC